MCRWRAGPWHRSCWSFHVYSQHSCLEFQVCVVFSKVCQNWCWIVAIILLSEKTQSIMRTFTSNLPDKSLMSLRDHRFSRIKDWKCLTAVKISKILVSCFWCLSRDPYHLTFPGLLQPFVTFVSRKEKLMSDCRWSIIRYVWLLMRGQLWRATRHFTTIVQSTSPFSFLTMHSGWFRWHMESQT